MPAPLGDGDGRWRPDTSVRGLDRRRASETTLRNRCGSGPGTEAPRGTVAGDPDRARTIAARAEPTTPPCPARRRPPRAARARGPSPPTASHGRRHPAGAVAPAGQPVPAGRAAQRGPGRGDPPRLAADPVRDRDGGARRPAARAVRARGRTRGPGDPAHPARPRAGRGARRAGPARSSRSTRATRHGTSSSVARTSSSARSAARPSSATSIAAGEPATPPTSSTTSA